MFYNNSFEHDTFTFHDCKYNIILIPINIPNYFISTFCLNISFKDNIY